MRIRCGAWPTVPDMETSILRMYVPSDERCVDGCESQARQGLRPHADSSVVICAGCGNPVCFQCQKRPVEFFMQGCAECGAQMAAEDRWSLEHEPQ